MQKNQRSAEFAQISGCFPQLASSRVILDAYKKMAVPDQLIASSHRVKFPCSK